MKRWAAGVITIAVTFVVTVLFVYVVSLALAEGNDSVRLPLLIVAAVIGLLGAIGFVVVAFSLYGLINGHEPLGLPEGSVRALIALLILVIFAAMTIFFFGAMRTPTPKDVVLNAEAVAAANDLAKQVLTILGTLLTAISSFYFGSQSATSAVKAAAGANPPAGGGGAAGAGSAPGGGAAGAGDAAGEGAGGGAVQPDGGNQSVSGGDVDVSTKRPIRVSPPLKLKRREEKDGMDEAN
ncbi:MAG TPA: hypothetical protein VJZ76_08830 [Thermoanaerobaculia bacterium]|nr:hypothetical protein [Thermoanaerobaculia bacterium]